MNIILGICVTQTKGQCTFLLKKQFLIDTLENASNDEYKIKQNEISDDLSKLLY